MQMNPAEYGIADELIRQISDPGQPSRKAPPFAIGMTGNDEHGTGNDKVDPKHDRNGQKEKENASPRDKHHLRGKPDKRKREEASDQRLGKDDFFEQFIMIKRCIIRGLGRHVRTNSSLA